MIFKTGKRLYIIVVLIGAIMLANIVLIYQNGQSIERNQKIITNAEDIKLGAEDIIQTLHLIDLGIRAYALTGNREMFIQPRDSSTIRKEETFSFLKHQLQQQGYPIQEIDSLKSDVDNYYTFVNTIGDQVALGNNEKATQMIAEDRGYPLWVHAQGFSKKIKDFENSIEIEARDRFQRAVKSSYWLQVFLFFITLPTLIYSVYYSIRSIKLSNQLRDAVSEKAEILAGQNEKLERLVRERTDEILAQNEEITAQNEEITTQNEKLVKAKNTIEEQQQKLELRNKELASEITQQNEELKLTNSELIAQNNKLEQFAYIISHNLRAPISRLLGLGNLLKKADDSEKDKINKMMIAASEELNEVINDMGEVLNIQKPGSKMLDHVNLDELLDKVKKMLQHEIKDTGAQIKADFNAVSELYTLPLYIENIFYNLLSNAIKYKHHQRSPVIEINTRSNGEYHIISFKDNGIGIDLERDKQKLFGLYMRFHFHVEGKGLGLFLVKKQVETLGGKIEVESEKGNGTTFHVKLKKPA